MDLQSLLPSEGWDMKAEQGRKRTMITRRSFAVLGATALVARPALAAEWPADRPITVVVPFPPGGGVDQMARVVLPYLQKQLPGANFIVENRAGAGSQIGMEPAVRSAWNTCSLPSPTATH